MYAQILGNLTRQAKALELLERLQMEELEFLMARKADEVSALEFSIHELLRQIAVEREDLKNSLQGVRVAEYANLLADEEDQKMLRHIIRVIDVAEQRCAKQAEKNTALSLALLDQSHDLMTYLHDQITPKNQLVYGAKGGYTTHRPPASILNGRL